MVASDGHYHKDCKRDFVLKFKDLDKREEERDVYLLEVINTVKADRSRIWYSVELYNLYTSNNDNVVVDCKTFYKEPVELLASFHARGYAELLCFNDHARGVLKMAKEGNASDDGIENFGRAINAECKEIKINTDTNDTCIDLEKSMESTSSTLERLLECVSSKFSNSLYSALIGNIVTSIVQNRTTHLQLSLGILFRHSKVTPNHLHDYRVTCTHDEVLRFKKSAAVNSAKDGYLQGVPTTNNELFQVVTDNYDTKMIILNNKLLCHCLTTILTKNWDCIRKTTFPCLKKKDLASPIEEANKAEISHYFGPKKPPMLSLPKSNLDETSLKMQAVSHARAEEIDFDFFNDIISKKECPEYNGYCTLVNHITQFARAQKLYMCHSLIWYESYHFANIYQTSKEDRCSPWARVLCLHI